MRLVVRDFQPNDSAAARVVYREEPPIILHHRISPDAFVLALRNLIQNAELHGLPNGVVEVVAGPGASVRVRNHGATVEPDLLIRLRERFQRGATSAKGTGLGLAVVDAILTQTGGSLILKSPAPGWTDGFEATMALNDDAKSRRSPAEP